MEQEVFNPITYKLLEKEIAQLKELLQSEVDNLKELMDQHDRLTAASIEKDMAATYAKQKETAAALDGLRQSFDENIKSATERNDSSVKNSDEKISTLERHMGARMVALQSTIEDKRDILYKGIQESFKNVMDQMAATKLSLEEKRDTMMKAMDEKVVANITREVEKFAGVDGQMKSLIDANAQVSNSGIAANTKLIEVINLWRAGADINVGSIQKKIGRVEAFIVAILLAIVLAVIKYLFKI